MTWSVLRESITSYFDETGKWGALKRIRKWKDGNQIPLLLWDLHIAECLPRHHFDRWCPGEARRDEDPVPIRVGEGGLGPRFLEVHSDDIASTAISRTNGTNMEGQDPTSMMTLDARPRSNCGTIGNRARTAGSVPDGMLQLETEWREPGRYYPGRNTTIQILGRHGPQYGLY